MEKQEKEIKIPKENKKKHKRKVSIFTVFLWLFLVITMSTIVVGSFTKKNAIEVTDNNWNISLVMYDRSGNTPNQAITDLTWNTTGLWEYREVVLQINYACTTGKAYNPGEMIIEVSGFGKNGSETNQYYYPSTVIAADKEGSSEKQYDWSYRYDEESNVYTFTNNIFIAENEHFEGTIQIVYDLEPRFKIQTDIEFQAKIKENIQSDEIIAMKSNVCNFHYIGKKEILKLSNKATVAPKTDYTDIEDILDDYYWVRYRFPYSTEILGNIDVMLSSFDPNDCIRVEFPEGCVVYKKPSNKLLKVNPKENNQYIVNEEDSYYVGYPKTQYKEGDSVTNIAELWGRYEDEEEEQKLSEATSTVNLVEFNFEYTGELYKVEKSGGSKPYSIQIKEEGFTTNWSLSMTAFYTGELMDVEIGDDLLYITRENGEITRLEEDEYYFESFSVGTFWTYNKYTGSSGDNLRGYNYDLQVRYKGSNEYISYYKGVIGYDDTIKFDRNDVVGVKLVIQDLDKTIYSARLTPKIHVQTQDCKSGSLYNFDYLQVYHKNEEGNRTLINEPTLDSYSYTSTKLKVAEYDQATYGTYMQRAYKEDKIMAGTIELDSNESCEEEINVPQEEKYKLRLSLSNSIHLKYMKVEKDMILKMYELLPDGMYLKSNEAEIINSLITNDSFKNLSLKDGTVFETKEELENYIKQHVTIEIDYNYRNSGRTKITLITNLNDINWDYYKMHDGYFSLEFEINTEVPYDSILEYGTKYTTQLYSMWNEQEYLYAVSPSALRHNIIDNGQYYDILSSDIDNDGNIREEAILSYSIINFTHAVSSQQAVIKQVRSDLTQGKYVEENAEVSPGEEYDYKLRVTTGANSIKDLILYDNIETIIDESGTDISTGWKGSFLGVDISYAESKGYAPKVYYSTELNPGKLTEVPDKWKLLDDSIDKSTVKSICVDLRYQEDGREMELSPNNVVYVLVKMQAPDDENLRISSNNMFWTNWRAIDPLGGIVDNVEGIYSNQVNLEISKKGITTSISGQKIWVDEENKNNTRPASITVKLIQDGVEYARKSVTGSDNWSYTFENVPVYRNNAGDQYEYTIEEELVENYITSYEGNNIINEVNLTEFEVEKIWDDNENENQKRPESIVVELKQEGKTIQEATLNEETNWKHTFTNLEKYNALGEEIVYSVDEKEFTNNALYVKEIVGGKITNKFVVPDERVKIIGSKRWDDNNNLAGKRPESVILQVKNGEEIVTEQVVIEESNWSYEFELAKYDESGNEIVYTIDEKEVGSKFYEKVGVEGNVVINKFVIPDEKIEIWVDKKWEDEDNKYGKRPESVILQIKNGEEVIEEVEISEENNWRHKFELTKYDEFGNEINYTIDEKETAEYYEKRIEGNTITNTCTYTPPTDTSDISIWIYVVVAIIAIVGIGVFTIVKVKQKKKLKK